MDEPNVWQYQQNCEGWTGGFLLITQDVSISTRAMGWQIYPVNCFITPCCFHLTLKCAIEQSGKMVNIKGQPHGHGWYSILVYFIYEMSRIKIVL